MFKKCITARWDDIGGMPLAAMSCGQIQVILSLFRYETIFDFLISAQVIRKLALVTLTGYMERYCPTHRSGWNWELPKFIKKIKAPDYKGTVLANYFEICNLVRICNSLFTDRKVFGVPFLLLLQRSGETLPKAIQTAIKWLKLNAMDQVSTFESKTCVKMLKKIFKLLVDWNIPKVWSQVSHRQTENVR